MKEATLSSNQFWSSLKPPICPLAESLDLYEAGVKLAARCGVLLEEAELRVRKWEPDGTLTELSDTSDP